MTYYDISIHLNVHYQLTGSKFATLHEELKKFGSYYFENRPKMAYETERQIK